jgi:RNA polymerase sigma-70 factor (ECF subfamily)
MALARGPGWPRLAFSRDASPARTADADSARFRETLLPHLDAAYGYARYLARDEAAAEDIVQESFLRALRSLDQCRGNPKPWLLAIVRNCFHDWVRANRRYVGIDDEANCDEAAPHAEDALEQAASATGVRHLVESLPEPFRATLVLRELEGLSYREIAEITAAPVGTVMSRLARARQMLAAMLTTNDDSDAEAAAR